MSADALRWLLLPGLDGSGQLFRWFRPYLRGMDAIVVEYPDAADWSFDAYAAHVAKAMGDARRCIVIAESFSGPVAMRLLQDAHVVGIVLVASFVRRPNPFLAGLPLFPVKFAQRIASRRSMLRVFCVGSDTSDDCVDELAEVVRSISPATLRSRLELLVDLDDRERLRRARVPILHLRARRDRLVCAVLSDNSRAGGLFHEAALDGPHFLLQARPEKCWLAIEDWLRSAFPHDGFLPDNEDRFAPE